MNGLQDLTTRQHCVYALHYHLVLVTKYRKKCLDSAMLSMIKTLANERLADREGELLEMNGEADHVHLLIALPPHKALSDFVNAIKTNTSRLLRRDFPKLSQVYREPVLWSRSYCVISCGGAPLEILKKYIEQQDRPE